MLSKTSLKKLWASNSARVAPGILEKVMYLYRYVCRSCDGPVGQSNEMNIWKEHGIAVPESSPSPDC